MSDYPMLISNKLHSFRNFEVQSYDTFVRCATFCEKNFFIVAWQSASACGIYVRFLVS